MSKASQSEARFVRALKRLPVDRPPVWLMRQAGRYLPEYREVRAKAGGFLDLCYTPDFAIEVTLQPLRRFPLDAAIIFSDILVIPHAMGQMVGFEEGRGPVLDPIKDDREIPVVEPDKITAFLDPVYQALRGVRQELDQEKSLIGFCGAPWTIATYMIEGGSSRDFARTRQWSINAPDSFRKLISNLEDAIVIHLIAQIKAGANAVQIFDSWAGILADGAFEEWSFGPISRIAERVKKACPDIPIIAFPRMAGIRYLHYADHKSVDAVSLDQMVPCQWAAENLQPHIAVQGNLDPAYLLAGGPRMEKEAKRIIGDLGKKPGFVFNLGHGVVKETPPDHVAALCDIVTASGAKN